MLHALVLVTQDVGDVDITQMLLEAEQTTQVSTWACALQL